MYRQSLRDGLTEDIVATILLGKEIKSICTESRAEESQWPHTLNRVPVSLSQGGEEAADTGGSHWLEAESVCPCPRVEKNSGHRGLTLTGSRLRKDIYHYAHQATVPSGSTNSAPGCYSQLYLWTCGLEYDYRVCVPRSRILFPIPAGQILGLLSGSCHLHHLHAHKQPWVAFSGSHGPPRGWSWIFGLRHIFLLAYLWAYGSVCGLFTKQPLGWVFCPVPSFVPTLQMTSSDPAGFSPSRMLLFLVFIDFLLMHSLVEPHLTMSPIIWASVLLCDHSVTEEGKSKIVRNREVEG